RAMRLSRQNIFLSAAYNLIALPAAVAGMVTPLLAAVVMASSSLLVILNALRAADGRERVPTLPRTGADR
ncbi:MAG: heavy metal translocating P-type ATPase, partial [Gemmatimonadaceae bacterium]|nr:heavy metal translocating P-type ATPase [Acetobacteraceae bacterium]